MIVDFGRCIRLMSLQDAEENAEGAGDDVKG